MGLVVPVIHPRLAGHLAVALHDYLRRAAVSSLSVPREDLQHLINVLRAVNRGQAGSALDSDPPSPDAAPVPARLLTYEQAGTALACSVSTVKRLVRVGALRSVGIGSAGRRIAVTELDRYVAAVSERSTGQRAEEALAPEQKDQA